MKKIEVYLGESGMKRIATSFEIILSVILLTVGLYMLYEGTSSKSTTAAATLIGGAVCFTMSGMTLFSSVRSILWHRKMLRHSMHGADLDDAASEHNRG
jgi:hypothetical protein